MGAKDYTKGFSSTTVNDRIDDLVEITVLRSWINVSMTRAKFGATSTTKFVSAPISQRASGCPILLLHAWCPAALDHLLHAGSETVVIILRDNID